MMTTGFPEHAAGLVFRSRRELDMVLIANHLVDCLENLGHRITATHIPSPQQARLTADEFEMTLTAGNPAPGSTLAKSAAGILSLGVQTPRGAQMSRFSRDSLLARCLQTLFGLLDPDFIKWVDTDVLVPAADFARAVGAAPRRMAPPRRIRPHQRFPRKRLPDIEEINEDLQKRLCEHDPALFSASAAGDRLRSVFTEGTHAHRKPAPRDAAADDVETAAPLRLSAWLISFAVALFALPVGAMLVVINLLRGENLRLASQTAALTGTFIALQSYGAMASAMSALARLAG
ncbi:MAG: hypothetical protein Kow0058_11910 [Roseovarius sp.]